MAIYTRDKMIALIAAGESTAEGIVAVLVYIPAEITEIGSRS